MAPRPVLSVVSHATGDWVIEHGACRLAVPAAIGSALQPLDGFEPDAELLVSRLEREAGLDRRAARALVGRLLAGAEAAAGPACLRGGPRWLRPRALWLRAPLVPAGWTAAAADRLRRWAAWPSLALSAVAGLAGYGLAATHPAPAAGGATDAAATLLLFLATALWHEFGHATALAREGYPPGGIGAGVLFLLPVLYADVSLLGAVSRAGRLRVDLAGVAFQLGLGGGLCALGAFWAPARAAGWLALFAVAWSLLPFVRSDGYWTLCDALELRDLRSRPSAGRRRRVHALVWGFRAASLLFLGLVCWNSVLRVSGWLRAHL